MDGEVAHGGLEQCTVWRSLEGNRMNSKERVLKTIAHEEPDRVPVGEWGIDHDHVSRIIGRHTYWRNRKDTTIALWEGRRDEVVESLKNDCVELVEKLDYDIVTVEMVPPKGYMHPDPPRKIAEDTWEDSRGNIYRYAASNDSIICLSHPEPKEEVTEEDIENAFKQVENMDESIFELIDFIGDRYGNEKAVLGRDIDPYGVLMYPFGGDFNHQLIISKLAPDEVKKMYALGLAYNTKIIQHYAEHNVIIGMEGYDFGMNTGCIMSPATINDVFMPFLKLLCDELKQNGLIPFFHSCGRIWEILGGFVEAGFKGYQSIQASAGMEWKAVKEKYGRKLTLWTGVQCETLVSGSLDDVEKEVMQALKDLMPGGGFIFGSTNSVQYGAKTDNYLKALDIVRKHGMYR